MRGHQIQRKLHDVREFHRFVVASREAVRIPHLYTGLEDGWMEDTNTTKKPLRMTRPTSAPFILLMVPVCWPPPACPLPHHPRTHCDLNQTEDASRSATCSLNSTKTLASRCITRRSHVEPFWCQRFLCSYHVAVALHQSDFLVK